MAVLRMPATMGHDREETIMRMLAILLSACALSATLSAQVPDFTPKTPLVGALLHNDVAEAKRLLARGADPNDSGFVGMPPIVLAILRQDVDLVRMMVARCADRNERDRAGCTALLGAAMDDDSDAQASHAV